MATDPRVEQRMQALAAGQKRRLRKAALKREWSAGEMEPVLRKVADLLERDKDGKLVSFKVEELLTTIPGIGKTKARMIANGADWIELTRRVDKLTDRQRGLLAKGLRQRADEVEARHVSAA